ncbi:GNAT family N-acetyltransferase [Lyticum sinuosum]|uniref:GNAT family N-acetyltransferase n=1 Tax=Lyticum sinuosum TaxID=1332059 RepID=A0AAE5AGK1_9RICK|nr:GNAT family protein [Lyticum sinuosum]MDZ5760877.1 GNAT family N-acetyltransferase [Lyticum sinuosum]
MKKVTLESFFSKFPDIDLGDFNINSDTDTNKQIKIWMRDMKLKDDKKYFELYSDSRVNFAHSDEDMPKSLEEANRSIKFWGSLFYNKRSIFWTIADKNTDIMIGNIGLVNFYASNKRAEISYDIFPEYHRNGIMSKALSAVLNIVFNRMSVFRIEARTIIDNIPSQMLLQKHGFKKEGILRGYRFIRGKSVDIMLFSLIKSDYELLIRNKFEEIDLNNKNM